MAKLFGLSSGTSLARWTGERQLSAFPSQWQLLVEATGPLVKKLLPLLQH